MRDNRARRTAMLARSSDMMSRRDFCRVGLLGITAAACSPVSALAPPDSVDVWVFHGTDKRKLMSACLGVMFRNGGFGRNVRTLALKVNAAWARTPEQGANTHPELVDGFLAGCREFGISELVLPEHPCNRAEQSFRMSGIRDAARKHGATMIDLSAREQDFVKVSIPGAKRLHEVMVARHFLEAGAVVNMPVAKHHGSAVLTMALKNWMGAVQDRGYWHRNDLHQCIADFGSYIKPAWTIIDATRIMMDRGPQGPTDNMKQANLLILSRDQVAADVQAARLFSESPVDVPYLRLAGDMRVGVRDPARMNVHRIEVAES